MDDTGLCMTHGAKREPIAGLSVHKVAQVSVCPKRLDGKRGERERERRGQERKRKPEKICQFDSKLLTRVDIGPMSARLA